MFSWNCTRSNSASNSNILKQITCSKGKAMHCIFNSMTQLGKMSTESLKVDRKISDPSELGLAQWVMLGHSSKTMSCGLSWLLWPSDSNVLWKAVELLFQEKQFPDLLHGTMPTVTPQILYGQKATEGRGEDKSKEVFQSSSIAYHIVYALASMCSAFTVVNFNLYLN